MFRHVTSVVLPVVLVWIGLVVLAIAADGDWPVGTERRISFVALCCVASFLLLVSTVMLRRMHGWDQLTIALAVAFGATSLMPFYLLALGLWRAFFREHQFTLTVTTAAILMLTSAVAFVMLVITPDGNGNHG